MDCRLCLNKCENALSIFKDDNPHNWTELIYNYLMIKIESADMYSTKICQSCSKTLEDFHNFYQHIQKCQLNLRNIKTDNLETTDAHDNVESIAAIATTTTLVLKEEQDFLANTESLDSQQSFNVQTENMEQHVEDESTNHQLIFEIKSEVDEQDSKTESMDPTFSDTSQIQTSFLSTAGIYEVSYEASSNACMDEDENISYTEATSELINQEIEMLTDEDLQSRTCPFCAKVLPKKRAVRDHIRYTHERSDENIKSRTCSICSKVLSTIFYLRQHMRCQHGENLEPTEQRTCPMCSQEYPTAKMMEAHISRTHGRKNENIEDRTCPMCSNVYPTIQGMKTHIRYYHKAMPDDIEDRTCPSCAKVFETAYKMERHMRLRHNPKDVDIHNRTCPVCALVCSTSDCLSQHMRRQHSSKEEKIENRTCNICSKVYTNSINLKTHMIRYHEQENVQDRTCPICLKELQSKYGIKRHMRKRHFGIKPFDCAHCKKSFILLDEFRKHVLGHSPTCKSDEQMATLAMYDPTTISTMAEEKLRTCVLCKKIYHRISQLDLHMGDVHRNSKPLSCKVCGERFTTRFRLNHHNENKTECAIPSKKIKISGIKEEPIEEKATKSHLPEISQKVQEFPENKEEPEFTTDFHIKEEILDTDELIV